MFVIVQDKGLFFSGIQISTADCCAIKTHKFPYAHFVNSEFEYTLHAKNKFKAIPVNNIDMATSANNKFFTACFIACILYM